MHDVEGPILGVGDSHGLKPGDLAVVERDNAVWLGAVAAASRLEAAAFLVLRCGGRSDEEVLCSAVQKSWAYTLCTTFPPGTRVLG